MRTTTVRIARRLACLLPAALAFSYGPAPMSLTPESRLWVDGTSTMKAWSCKATAIEATIDASGPNAVEAVMTGEKVVKAVEVRIPAAKLDCRNGTMNDHMRKALKAKAHPVIAFTITSYDVARGTSSVEGLLNGQLSLAGNTLPIAVKAVGSAGPDGTLHVTGSHAFPMKRFGIKPPSLMLGSMNVGDSVTVNFDLYVKN